MHDVVLETVVANLPTEVENQRHDNSVGRRITRGPALAGPPQVINHMVACGHNQRFPRGLRHKL